MEIKIDSHTIERAEERGTNEKEIKDVINTGFSIPGKYGRTGKAKILRGALHYSGSHCEER